MATKKVPSKTGKKNGRPKAPRCKRCQKPIHVPPGWSGGPAVRRHYWKHHPQVMRGRS